MAKTNSGAVSSYSSAQVTLDSTGHAEAFAQQMTAMAAITMTMVISICRGFVLFELQSVVLPTLCFCYFIAHADGPAGQWNIDGSNEIHNLANLHRS